jgi:hypothetical protein
MVTIFVGTKDSDHTPIQMLGVLGVEAVEEGGQRIRLLYRPNESAETISRLSLHQSGFELGFFFIQ